jgi:hypothetical protein
VLYEGAGTAIVRNSMCVDYIFGTVFTQQGNGAMVLNLFLFFSEQPRAPPGIIITGNANVTYSMQSTLAGTHIAVFALVEVLVTS